MRFSIRALSLGATVAVIALAMPFMTEAHSAPRSFFGVTPTTAPTNADLQRMGQARVGTLREPFGWEELEPSPGVHNFSDTDRVVALAAAEGIRVMPMVFGTPRWARNCDGIPAFYCDRVTPMRTPQGSQRWPELLRALVARYGSAGTLWTDSTDPYAPPYLPVVKWQLWNEPNSTTYFRPRPNPREYWRLLQSGSLAVRGTDPKAQIVLGGLYGTPPGGIAMWRFLDRLYGFKGARRAFHAVAIHPYSPNIKGIQQQIERTRDVLAENGARRTKIYLTEVGWGSGTGRGNLYKGLAGQASLLRKTFKFAAKNRKRYRLGGVHWFSWRDMPPGHGANCAICESFGLLTVDSAPKPSMGAFTRFTGGG